MATLKLKHLLLYFAAFVLLYIADIPGGALISLAAWLQVCILLWKKTYSAKNQILVFVYFLTLVPLLIFLGSSGSFISIYLRENSWTMATMAAVLCFILCWLTIASLVFSAAYFEPHSNLMSILKNSFSTAKKNGRFTLAASLLLLFIIVLPMYLRTDYKIVLALILVHLYLNLKQLQGLLSSR